MKFLFFLILSVCVLQTYAQTNFKGTIKYKLSIFKEDGDTLINYIDVIYSDTSVIMKYKERQLQTEILNIKTGDLTSYYINPIAIYTSKGDSDNSVEKYISNQEIFYNDTLKFCNSICNKASFDYKKKYKSNGAMLEITTVMYLSKLYFNTANSLCSYNPFTRNGFNKIPLYVYESESVNVGFGFTSQKKKKYEAISIEPM